MPTASLKRKVPQVRKLKVVPTEAPQIREAYKTSAGKMLVGRIETALDAPAIRKQKGKISLILTSPPFPLVRKKRYGNEVGETYLSWLSSLAPRLSELLTPDGSIVIEIGNAWVDVIYGSQAGGHVAGTYLVRTLDNFGGMTVFLVVIVFAVLIAWIMIV